MLLNIFVIHLTEEFISMRLLKMSLYYLIITFVCLELAFWVLGYRPYINQDYKVVSEPSGAFEGDSILGLKLNPGVYNITLNDSLTFIASHNELGNRIVSTEQTIFDTVPKIHLFGCSFTYGYGVNDEQTFAALLQKSNPNFQIINHAVIGYGTIQAFLQLQNEVIINPGDIVVINFASVHFERNILSQKYRSDLKIGFENSSEEAKKNMAEARFPFLNNNFEITYANWSDMYEHWTGRRYLCSVNYLQSLYDIEADKKLAMFDITKYLIQSIVKTVAQKDAIPIINCLDKNEQTVALKNSLANVNWNDVNFNFQDTTCINHPYDAHPNAKGHQMLFENLNAYLKILMDEN